MPDYGAAYTDKEIAKLDKEIQSIYKEAEKDIQKKMDDFNAKYKVKEAKYQQKVASGQMTQEDFDRWKKGQVFQGKQWQAKKDEILNVIHNSNVVATNMINGESIHVFAANANYMSYDLEHSEGVNFGFALYDSNTVTNLIKDNPQILPKWKIDKPKDYTWSQKKLNRSITQGIIQGESLEKIANRLSDKLVSTNQNKMRTFARTAMTGAQNSGRQTQLQNAKKLGIECVKEWMATLDSHTRDTHKDIDGEQVEVNKEFSNKCKYPGDPGGPPAEVYNCRCTMVSDVKKYPSIYNRYDNETRTRIRNMSYREWEKAKKQGGNLAPYSINKIALGDLFAGLSQNGAYTKIHDVDVKLSNQFYKELQAMGKAYSGGAKPAQVWSDYLNDSLPDEVSADKLENIMKQYKDKASKTLVKAKETLTEEKTLASIKSQLDFDDFDFKTLVQAKNEAGFEGNNWDFFQKYKNGNISSKTLDKALLSSNKTVQIKTVPPVSPPKTAPIKIDYSEFGGEKAFNILAKYDNLDDLLFNGTNEEFKYLIGEAFKGKNGELTADLFAKAKIAKNGVSGSVKATKIDSAVKSIPKAKNAVKGAYKSTEEWITAAKNNPDVNGMLEIEEKMFGKFTSDQVDALVTYTGSSYDPMNMYLRYLGAGMDERTARTKSGADSYLVGQIDLCKKALKGAKLDQDMVLRRGTDVGDIAGLFMKGNFSDNCDTLRGKTAQELNDMFQGEAGTYFGFTSTSSQWDKGFSGGVEVIINAPKGSQAASIMKISQYGTSEGETLLNANTKVRCDKIEESDGHFGSKIRMFLTILN